MSDVVLSYLFDYNYANGRPPTIGEEHEVTSVDGRLSNHSSVSGKSEVSTATPRRTDVDMGYEPEGSASPFPSYQRWKLSLHNMLEDSEGVNVFKNFLEETKQESILDCWLALKGFRNFGLISNSHNSGNSSAASSTTGSSANRNAVKEALDLETMEKRIKLAKTIYHHFMGNRAPKSVSSIIKEPTKQYIRQKIKEAKSEPRNGHDLDSELFSQAQHDIELNFESNSYRKFLESDRFYQYAAQCDSLSPKASSNVPQPPVPRQVPQPKEPDQSKMLDGANEVSTGLQTNSGYLPTLEENQMWDPRFLGENTMLRPNTSSLARAAMLNNKATNDRDLILQQRGKQTAASPYYTPSSYWVPPASAVGSDQASKSSDATSDTLSMTDTSSVDGPSYPRSGSRRLMRKQAMKNPSNTLPDCCGHVPRTSRTNNIPMLAQNHPQAFFEQLRAKLEKVIESRRKQKQQELRARVEQNRAAVATTMEETEDSSEQILDSHIARVMDSPAERSCQPVLPGATQRRPAGAQGGAFQSPHPEAYSADPRHPQRNRAPGASSRDTATLRKSGDDSSEVNVGLVPAMAQNEVPDVATGVNPVDKNLMIDAWIRMGNPGSVHARNKRPQRNRRPGLAIETVPEEPAFVNPINSTGLNGASSHFHRDLPLAPLAQDQSMPPLAQPDPSTQLEEVKRRLIDEAETLDQVPNLGSLRVFDEPRDDGNPIAPYNPASSHCPTHTERDACCDTHSTDTESSTETATFANTTNIQAPSSSVPASISVQPPAVPNETTVVYLLPGDTVPYKVRMPYWPLTLGQFKSCLAKKDLNCTFYFKQYSSVSREEAIFFEYTKDDDDLPLHEGIVKAKLRSDR